MVPIGRGRQGMGLLRLHLQLEVMHLMRLALCSQLVMTLAIIIMDEIIRISTSLIDIALDSFSVCNRSLEHFAQLSEKMLQLVQTQNTSHLVSTRIAIGKLREKIGDFRNLLTQINSNPSFDYTSQLEVSVNGISKSCRDLYGKLYANK